MFLATGNFKENPTDRSSLENVAQHSATGKSDITCYVVIYDSIAIAPVIREENPWVSGRSVEALLRIVSR